MPHYKQPDDLVSWEMMLTDDRHRVWHAYHGRALRALCEKVLHRANPTHRTRCTICPDCMRLAKYHRSGVGVLQYFRMTRGWYIGALAKAAGMDSSYLSRTEHGSRQPSRIFILRLCKILILNEEEINELLVAFGYAPRSLRHQAWTHALEEVASLQRDYAPEQLEILEQQILRLITFYREHPEHFPMQPLNQHVYLTPSHPETKPLLQANHQERRDDYFARRRQHQPRGSGPAPALEAFRAESKRYSEERKAQRNARQAARQD